MGIKNVKSELLKYIIADAENLGYKFSYEVTGKINS